MTDGASCTLPKRQPFEVKADRLDLADLIRRDDHILCGQMAGEPQTLTEMLVAQRQAYAGAHVFVGVLQSDTFISDTCSGLRFSSFGAMEKTARLLPNGAFDILPESLGSIARRIGTGDMRCDVVLVQLSPGRSGNGPFSFGVTNDVLPVAMSRARLVIAEINEAAPWTVNDRHVAPDEVDIIVRTSRPLPTTGRAQAGKVERDIADHCARFIEDGNCLQIGIGGIPDALLAQLSDRRDLGIHSGMLSDGAARLIESGAVTNARKTVDRGISVAAMASGSQALYDFLDRNAAVRISASNYTHSLATIGRIENFTAINGALEVDLFGAVNSESVNGRMIGGTGGLPDFVAGALIAPEGRSIIAVSATTANGRHSRIVARLNGPTTISRTHADVIVTQFGSAELRGQGLRERARRMIAIADPAFREDLTRQAQDLF